MFKIKQIPEDFIVKENISFKILDKGKYYIFLLKKKNYNTLDAIKHIANALKIYEKDVSFSGLKDRNAITEQYISILSRKKLNTEYNFKDINLKFVGFSDEKIFPGRHISNSFEITVRNITNKPKKIEYIVNYFGTQRFSENNAKIGRMIIKQEFDKAIELILKTLKINNTNPKDEDLSIIEFYEKNKTNYVGIMNKINKKLLVFYIQSYQSYIWNKCVEKYVSKLKNQIESDFNKYPNQYINKEMPIIGFSLDENNEFYEIIMQTLQEEKISPRDFIIRKYPELSVEGSSRKIFVKVENLKISDLEDDELNAGMKKCIICFELQKGAYATECIRQMFE